MARDAFSRLEPIILGKGMDWMRIAHVADSVASIEAMLESGTDGRLMKRYPTDMIVSLSKANNSQIVEAGCLIQRSSFVNILSAVRNLVLDWSMALERAGVTGHGISFTPEEQKQARAAPAIVNVGTIESMTGNIGVGIVSGDIINAPVNLEKVRNLCRSSEVQCLDALQTKACQTARPSRLPSKSHRTTIVGRTSHATSSCSFRIGEGRSEGFR